MEKTGFTDILKKSPCFFLGANSGNGFVNHFSQCYQPEQGETLYIIKGGPGTGKSTFMKGLVLELWQHNVACELYFCSSDPDSLDGVRFPSLGIAVVDGTSPHAMEPKMLGITEEILFVGEHLNSEKLNKETIIPLYRENALYHKKTARYLAAAARLMDDSFAVACNGIYMERVEQTARRIAVDFIPYKGKNGTETKRFLSGFTPKGYVLLENTLSHFADTILAVEDEYGGVSSVFLAYIKEHALASGYQVITCPCALLPHRKIDHVIIPELRLAFCSTNWFMPITVDTSRRIHARRFCDYQYLGDYKQRLRFNRRATEELLDGAYENLKEAKAVHDCLEQHYVQAMDFQGVSNMLTNFTNRVLKKI